MGMGMPIKNKSNERTTISLLVKVLFGSSKIALAPAVGGGQAGGEGAHEQRDE
jgi:hypothetical protein